MNDNHKPLISIITVTLNAANHLEKCIQSIHNQSYKYIDHVIIDGGSTDGTIDILKKYNDKIGTWISEPDSGIYNAMNKGLAYAKGDWIYFLGADDFLYPGFSEMASYLHGSNRIFHGHCLWGNSILGGVFPKYKLTHECICHHSILYPKSVFDKYKYNEKYKIAADYLLNILCWHDKQFSRTFIPLLIANFAKGGLSEQIEDKQFISDFPQIVKRHFSLKHYIKYLIRKRKEKNNL